MIQYLTEGLDGTDSVINSIKYYRLSVSVRDDYSMLREV